MCISAHATLSNLEPVCMNSHVDSRDVIKRIEADGWVKVRQKGSHAQFKHPSKPGLVTLPTPRRDIPLGTLRSIARQAGVSMGDE